jgi:cytochrome P450
MTDVASPPDLDEQLTGFFSADPAILADPYPMYRRLLAEAPAYRHGSQVVVSAFKWVDFGYRSEARFPPMAYVGGPRVEQMIASMPSELVAPYRDLIEFESNFIWMLGGARHRKLRTIMGPAFMGKEVARIEQLITEQCDTLLTAATAEGEFDFVQDFAYRLPLLMVSSMLEVPASDMDRIHEWSMAWAAFQGVSVNFDPIKPWHDALQEAREYVQDVVEAHRRKPPSAALAKAIMDAYGAGDLERDEVVAMVMGMLFAAHETTTNLISSGVRLLLEHRDQWEQLCANPALAPGAVEEVLRYASPARFGLRVAASEYDFGDVAIQPGETLCMLISAGNRDPDAFAEPDRFDIHRQANKHIAFAAGPKYCPGAALARAEGRIALTALATRHPEIELMTDAFDLLPYPIINGLRSLPVKVAV